MSENEGGKQPFYKVNFKDKGSRRLLFVAGGVIVVATGFAIFGPGRGTSETSAVRNVPVLNSTQGGAVVTPQYRDELERENERRAQQALKTGGSATPTILAETTGSQLPRTLEPQAEQPKEEPEIPTRPTPKAEVPRADPNRFTYQPPQTRAPVPQQVDKDLVQAMQKQMAAIVKGASEAPAAQTVYLYTDREGRQGTTDRAQRAAAPVQQAAVSSYQQQARFKAPAPGTIIYAQLVGRVNSDVPGPVIAEVLQGPFSGGRLLGSFQTTEQGVVVTFNTMTLAFEEDGETRTEVLPIRAVAVDTEHLGTALATDIDRHLFEKIAFGFATSFLKGLGDAISGSGDTTVIVPGATVQSEAVLTTRDKLLVAGGAAADKAGQVLQQQFGNRKTTITVEAGTPFGLLFLGSGN